MLSLGKTYARWPIVAVNGVPIDVAREGFLEEVVVDDDLNLPTMFSITLRAIGLDMPGVRIGATVEISAPSGLIHRPLVTGEVTTITGDFDPDGRRIHLRGYDVSHRLHRGRQTRTFLNVTDSDICRRVADAVGIDVGTIEPTTQAHDHVSQANQSDWEFLETRARAIGFVLTVEEGKLNFKRPAEASTGPGEGDLREVVENKLVFGQELIEYRPRLASAEQVANVEVRGWDSRNKREIVGRSVAGATTAETSGASPTSLAQTFGGPTFVEVAHSIATTDEADAAAATIAQHIGSSFAEAEGRALGNMDLRSGTAVSISGVAEAFTGRFVLSHTRHVFNREGYRTDFAISGRQQRSLLGLVTQGSTLASRGSASAGSRSIHSLVPAIVTANQDPEQEGRVKLKFPWLDAGYESTWAPVVQLGAGPRSGAVFIPEVADLVLAGFEFGDINRPYVIGSLYNGVDKPRLGDDLFDNGKVKRRGFVSRKGHRLVFFDDDRKSGIALLTSSGKLRVALNESGSEVRIYGDPKVVVEAAREIDVRSQGTLNIEAKGKITIKSDSVVDIDGSLIQLN